MIRHELVEIADEVPIRVVPWREDQVRPARDQRRLAQLRLVRFADGVQRRAAELHGVPPAQKVMVVHGCRPGVEAGEDKAHCVRWQV